MTENMNSTPEASAALPNPISEADFESIDRLFNKDPQFLTEEDIQAIVLKLRSGRGKWLHESEKRSKAKTKAKLSPEESKALLGSLNISF